MQNTGSTGVAYDAMKKMELRHEVVKVKGWASWNDAGSFTVESMKAALMADDAALLKRPDGSTEGVKAGGNLKEVFGQLGGMIDIAVDAKLADFKPGMDLAEVQKVVADEVAKINKVTTVELKRWDGQVVKVGAAHKDFPVVAEELAFGGNVWVYGPAGSGKTEAALIYAKAAGKPYHLVPCHRDLSPGRVVGTTNVINGEWIDGSIHKLLRDGGIVIFDEIDRAMPSFPVALNSILAQRVYERNGEIMPLHAETQFYVTANTLFGATNDHTAANKQDQAFINRFTVIEWLYDEEFELALVAPFGSKGTEWAKFVQRVRRKAEELGITSGKVTPRQMLEGAKRLAAGLDQKRIERTQVFDRFSPNDRSKLRAAVGK